MNNTKSKSEFFMDHVYLLFIAWIWYKNIFFKNIETLSLKESRLILSAIVILLSLAGILLGKERQRNGVCVFSNVIIGFGLYTVLAYLPLRKKLILIILLATTAFSLIYAVMALNYYKRQTRIQKETAIKKVFRIGHGIRLIICFGLTNIMFFIGINAVLGTALINPSVVSTRKSGNSGQTITNNIDTLILLDEDRWAALSVDEKLDVLQTVANIEQRYLGLPHELNVGASNLKEGLEGYYTDQSHEIIINLDCLIHDSSYEMMTTIAHEAFHALQYRMIDAYDEAGDDLKGLRFYKNAAIYKKEFSDYKDGFNDFEMYYSQECEEDARIYSEEAVNDYFARIYEYTGKCPSSEVQLQPSGSG